MAWVFDTWFYCRNHASKLRLSSTTWNLRFFLYLLIINKFCKWWILAGLMPALGCFYLNCLIWQDIPLIPLHLSCICRLFSWSSVPAGLQFWHLKTFRYLHSTFVRWWITNHLTVRGILLDCVKLRQTISQNVMPWIVNHHITRTFMVVCSV